MNPMVTSGVVFRELTKLLSPHVRHKGFNIMDIKRGAWGYSARLSNKILTLGPKSPFHNSPKFSHAFSLNLNQFDVGCSSASTDGIKVDFEMQPFSATSGSVTLQWLCFSPKIYRKWSSREQ